MSDDKIAEIKERHFYDEHWRNGPSMGFETICPQTHADRATLLAEVDRQRAENERLRGALEYMVNVCPAIDPDGEKAHERARNALEGKP